MAVPPRSGGRLPKLDLLTLSPPWWWWRFAPAGAASAPSPRVTRSRTSSVLERFGMAPPCVVVAYMSGHLELQPRQLAERAPCLRLAPGVQHLVVRPAEA